uniref:Protein NSP-INTERACTING KINASE 3 n=1 Tax=Noccaea caerulescens TaxID=107243 RepID=A0A1J3H3G3_NOCCA
MPKGSLDHHLYPHTRTDLGLQQEYPVLNWETRMKIAEGVADALVYLHDQRKLIHGDVNVSNVLLAEDHVPKLGDFGLATEIAEQQSKINPIKGTPGCIAPETEENGVISTKSDVYCYGVFLIMLFTGRKAYDRERSLQTRKIADWFIKLRGEEMIRCSKHKGQQKYRIMVDMALGNKFSEEGLERLFQAVRLCLEPDVSTRLNMTSVRAMVHEAATKRRSFEQAATSDSSVE